MQDTPSLVEHPRSASEIATLLAGLLSTAAFASGEDDLMLDALVRILARYGEIVTGCLNASADMHLNTFSAMLNRKPRPAAAAEVLLSFRAAPGAVRVEGEPDRPIPAGRRPVLLPMNTRVAARSGGSAGPALYETMEDLAIVRGEPVRGVLCDAGHRRIANADALFSPAGFDAALAEAFSPATYQLHISRPDLFDLPGLHQLTLRIAISDPGLRDPAWELAWIVPTAKGDLPLRVDHDTTEGLARSGEIVLVPPTPWPETPLNGISGRWLTLRLRHTASAEPPAGPWRPPRIAALDLFGMATPEAESVAAACHDSFALDASKDFLPFAERPRFGSTFQMLSPLFREPGARIQLLVRLTNPADARASPIPPVSVDHQPNVTWEIATAGGFRTVSAEDGTHSLTQDGAVTFDVPNDVAPTTIGGKSGVWVRARLVSGNYGSIPVGPESPVPVPRAPSVRSLTVRSTLARGPLRASCLVVQGPLACFALDPGLASPVAAFAAPDVDGPALYLGIGALGALQAFDAIGKGCELTWQVIPAPATPPIVLSSAPPAQDAPRWQMLSGCGWQDIAARDGSAGLTRAGIVRLTLPDDPMVWEHCALEPVQRKLVWLRVIWKVAASRSDLPALPLGLVMNSVTARHAQVLTNEIVGSSNGRRGQVFKALRTPIIGGVRLEVREAGDVWTAWTEVEEHLDSTPYARDFTLDRQSGELHFGDGRHGRIPPAGANNIRLRAYASGGGREGNQPAGMISQLRSAVPAVDAVTNHAPATGGFDAEDTTSLRNVASAWLRHRDRAICEDDYADLALRASPKVARAFCVAGRDLTDERWADGRWAGEAPGVVSLIVIPHDTRADPQPEIDLLASVKRYLDARRPPSGRLVLVGPTYTLVSVRLQVRVSPLFLPSRVSGACARAIRAFLHPLNGGADGRGWSPGRRPHRSDLYNLLRRIEGVETVHGLTLMMEPPRGGPVIVTAGEVRVDAGSEA